MTDELCELIDAAQSLLGSGCSERCPDCGSRNGAQWSKHYAACRYRRMREAIDKLLDPHPDIDTQPTKRG